jgi:hypothetical protein
MAAVSVRRRCFGTLPPFQHAAAVETASADAKNI